MRSREPVGIACRFGENTWISPTIEDDAGENGRFFLFSPDQPLETRSVTEPVINRNVDSMSNLPKRRILNSRLAEIGHSRASKPEFVLEGIGPAEFRSHYLRLESGVILDLFTAELTVASGDAIVCAGETVGIPVEELIGRTVTGVWNDDTFSCIVILDNDIYLKDANDGVYGNPLRAGRIMDDYTEDQRQEFTDYWTEEPRQWDGTRS